MFSIDQNCLPLWDVVPKIQALVAAGKPVRHFVEDVDAAFTAVGASVDDPNLRLARERYYTGGEADWGAALFYSEFLGRLPVDIRRWEPITGMKTKALARQLSRSVDDLYDEFSPGDNWQLIGSSYAGDRRHHRTIADLSVAEVGPFVREIFAKARADMKRAFPARVSQERLANWFAAEQDRLERLLNQSAECGLAELYRRWLTETVPGSVTVDLMSNLLAVGADPARLALVEIFLRDYDLACGLYNEAMIETDVGLRPLRTDEGELPFFAAFARDGREVRTAVHLDGNQLRVGDRTFALADDHSLPTEALRRAGVRSLVAKAALLVIQVRLGPGGDALALPYRGSLYTPAVHRLTSKLRQNNLLPAALKPLMRVRFRLLDRMRSIDTSIRLPKHLTPYFGQEELPARVFAEGYASLADEATGRLEAFRDTASRERWQRQNLPDEFERLAELDNRSRRLGRTDPKSPAIRDMWKEIKFLKIRVLEATLRQIDGDTQMSQIDYWDSRGALLPWCIALGGESFYNEVIARADVYEESPE